MRNLLLKQGLSTNDSKGDVRLCSCGIQLDPEAVAENCLPLPIRLRMERSFTNCGTVLHTSSTAGSVGFALVALESTAGRVVGMVYQGQNPWIDRSKLRSPRPADETKNHSCYCSSGLKNSLACRRATMVVETYSHGCACV